MMAMWIINGLLISLFFIISCLYIYFKFFIFNFWRKKGIPYDEPTFPAGNILDGILNRKLFGEVYADIYFKYRSQPYIGVYSIFKPTLVIIDPEIIRLVLVKEFGSFSDRGMYSNDKVDPLSGNLFLLPGQKWSHLRACWTPILAVTKLKQMFVILKEKGNLFEQFLEKKVNGNNEIEMKEIAACFLLDVIISTAFGMDSNCLENPDLDFRYYTKKVFESRPLMNSVLTFASPLLEFFSIPYTDKKVSKFFIETFEKVVEYRETNNIKRKDFLNSIIELMKDGYVKCKENKEANNQENPRKFTMLEGAAQAFTFFTAGFESPAATVAFCLHELAFNQEIQENVYEEIDTILEKHGDITYDAINEMHYLQMVIYETLRKYTTLPHLSRACTKNVELPNFNVVIPKGTNIIIPILGIHNDPEYYPEPEKFIPERFTDVEIHARHRYVYLPFGEGPRICPGLKYGILQVKVALVNALKKFKYYPGLKSKPKLEFCKGSLTLSVKDEIHLRIQHRL